MNAQPEFANADFPYQAHFTDQVVRGMTVDYNGPHKAQRAFRTLGEAVAWLEARKAETLSPFATGGVSWNEGCRYDGTRRLQSKHVFGQMIFADQIHGPRDTRSAMQKVFSNMLRSGRPVHVITEAGSARFQKVAA